MRTASEQAVREGIEQLLTKAVAGTRDPDRQIEALNRSLVHAGKIRGATPQMVGAVLGKFLSRKKNWHLIRKHRSFGLALDHTPDHRRPALIVRVALNMMKQATRDFDRVALDGMIEFVQDKYPPEKARAYFEECARIFERYGRGKDSLYTANSLAIRMWTVAERSDRAIPLLERVHQAAIQEGGSADTIRDFQNEIDLHRDQLKHQKRRPRKIR